VRTSFKTETLRTWIQIDTKVITHNFRAFKNLLAQKTKLMIVVKSNAYGHDMVLFAKEIEKIGTDFLGVDSFEEALELRKNKISSPILILGYTPPACMDEAARKGVTITVSNFDTLRAMEKSQFRKKIKVHIKVDTGLGRQGFLEHDIEKVVAEATKNKHISITGLYTHFAGAETPKLAKYSKRQITVLEKWIKSFKKAGFSPIVHAGASAATLFFPEFHFDMVRVGLGAYGLYASEEMRRKAEGVLKLIPVMTWKTIVSETKRLPKGTSIGYDLTETLKRDSTVAICPVGYWHGYPRLLSSKGIVIVRGKRAKVLGRISMDMIAVDVTDIPGIRQGDSATLLGKGMPAEEVARLAGTINYEIITRINPLIKRIYT